MYSAPQTCSISVTCKSMHLQGEWKTVLTLVTWFCPNNLQYFSYKYVFGRRLGNNVDPDQMVSSEVS